MNRNIIILSVLLAIGTAIVFMPAFQYDFLNWDDNKYIYANPHLKALGADYVKWAFTTNYYGPWQPMVWLSIGLEYTLWGINPMGYHITNIMLHALNVFLVMLVTSILFRHKGLNRDSVLAGIATVGMIFAVHPTRVQSVVWLAERKDMLFMFFLLLSIFSYLKYISAGQPARLRHYMASLIFFSLSLMSKAMAISLPAILLIMDYYPYGRLGRKGWLKTAVYEKLPYVMICLSYVAVELYSVVSAGILTPERYSFTARMLLSVKSLAFYFIKILIPLELSPYYILPENVSILAPEYIASIVLIALITLMAVKLRARHPVVLASWCFYLVTLFPALSLVQHGVYTMAIHYMYLPILGPAMVLGAGAAELVSRADLSASLRKGKRAVIFVLALLFVFYSSMTLRLMPSFRNSVALWSYAAEFYPGSMLILANLSEAQSESGKLKEAIETLDRVLALYPDTIWLYYERAMLHRGNGNYRSMINDIVVAIKLKEALIETREDREELSRYYNDLGFAYIKILKPEQALASFSKAILFNPKAERAYHNRALLYLNAGVLDKAYADFRSAASLGHQPAIEYLESIGVSMAPSL